MAFLLQMLQQAQTSGISQMPGQQEGTNSSGGSTERPTEEQQGNFAGETEDERKVQIGSGLAQDLPAEYREAFEAYFEALEQNEFTE